MTLRSQTVLYGENDTAQSRRQIASKTPQWEWHCKVKYSQRRVRTENFVGFWLLLKEHAGKNLVWVNTSTMGEKI